MKNKSVIVQLKGGLGNQMFQYAAGRALAIRNNAELYVDANSGFARDKVYRRTFELGLMPIATEIAGLSKQMPYWFEKLRSKMTAECADVIQRRPWGTLISETSPAFHSQVPVFNSFDRAWMSGYWQCERYFLDYANLISRELAPPAPEDPNFQAVAEKMASCNSVAVGVRLFEEVPGTSKSGVGGVTPVDFYTRAAQRLSREVNDLEFFVFCTNQSPLLAKIKLPGRIHYITHDNGFEGTIPRLWLISRCRHHILSNSSFYWWGAWLAEQQRPDARIFASDMFVNRDCIPGRWISLGENLNE